MRRKISLVKTVQQSKKARIYGLSHAVVRAYRRLLARNRIRQNEKQLNGDLIKMSTYYCFKINVTNCYSRHEKGSVEKAVDVVWLELFIANFLN